MAKKDTKRFIFNCDWQDILRKLPDASRLKVLDAVIDYVRNGNTAELDLAESIAFDFICKEIDWNNDKYEEICKKRSEAGKKGNEKRWGRKQSQDIANIANATFATFANRKNRYNKNDNKNKNEYELSNDNIEKEIALTCKEKEQEEKPKRKNPEWKKPTIEEIKAYAKEKGYNNINAEDFWNFYESKGWMVGKNHMVNWHSSVALWNRNQSRSRTGKESAAERMHFEGERDPHAYDEAEEFSKWQKENVLK